MPEQAPVPTLPPLAEELLRYRLFLRELRAAMSVWARHGASDAPGQIGFWVEQIDRVLEEQVITTEGAMQEFEKKSPQPEAIMRVCGHPVVFEPRGDENDEIIRQQLQKRRCKACAEIEDRATSAAAAERRAANRAAQEALTAQARADKAARLKARRERPRPGASERNRLRAKIAAGVFPWCLSTVPRPILQRGEDFARRDAARRAVDAAQVLLMALDRVAWKEINEGPATETQLEPGQEPQPGVSDPKEIAALLED